MCEQKCYPNRKVREALSYLSEDWYTRMVLHKDVSEVEITGGVVWPQKKRKKKSIQFLLARTLFTDL